MSALFIRFILGGAAVVVSTLVSRKLGEKAEGIFAAFLAVYLAALLTVSSILVGMNLFLIPFYYQKGL